jgi:hypothetical protein
MFKALWFAVLLWVATVLLLPQVAWGEGRLPQPVWLAQAPFNITESQSVPPQPLPTAVPDGTTPSSESDRPAALKRSPDKANAAAPKSAESQPTAPQPAPRSPYDMEALKAFDAGSHRKN